MPFSETPQAKFQGRQREVSDTGLRVFGAQTLNLRTVNDTPTQDYRIIGLNYVSVRVQAGTWGTAVVKLNASVDGVNFDTTIATLNSGTVEAVNQSVQGYTHLQFEVTTADGSASTVASLHLYAYLIHA